MRTIARQGGRIVGIALAVLIMTACRTTQSYVIGADDTVVYSANFGMTTQEASEEYFDMYTNGDEICDAIRPAFGTRSDQVDFVPYDNEDEFGCVVGLTAPLDSFDDETEGAAVITRDGDVVTFDLDNSADDTGDGPMDGEQWISVTFPGEVLSHEGGTISGTTVVWEGEDYYGPHRASGRTGHSDPVSSDSPTVDSRSESVDPLLIGLIAVAAGGVIALGVVLVAYRRSQRSGPPF